MPKSPPVIMGFAATPQLGWLPAVMIKYPKLFMVKALIV